jgi:[acyl-carrier-protein] S-malonyltransferase
MTFEDGLKLVKKRGEAMQAAANSVKGSMVSIIGVEEAKIRQLCEEASEGELLDPVNFNCPGQIVVSGTIGACERVERLAEKYGAVKAIRLEVAGAFHTPLMFRAAEALQEALWQSRIASPGSIKTVVNITAEYYVSAEGIIDGLTRQLVSPILWQKCMERLLADGVEQFYEIGPGRVLTGLMKRINRKTKVTNVSDLSSLRALLEGAPGAA